MTLSSDYPLDHVGIAVRDLESAIADYQRSFGYQLGTRELVTSQGVEVAFLHLPNTMLELLASRSPESKLEKFLATRGPGLHHLCYRVTNIERELARLASLGYTLIDPHPRPGAHGTRIAFLHPKAWGGVLTELCEYPNSPDPSLQGPGIKRASPG